MEESGEAPEEIPFDEHLLERISTLEDVVKRTGDAVKSLLESLGNLEKNLFVAHTGILALQERRYDESIPLFVESLERALDECACAREWDQSRAAAWWRDAGEATEKT